MTGVRIHGIAEPPHLRQVRVEEARREVAARLGVPGADVDVVITEPSPLFVRIQAQWVPPWHR